MRHIKINNNEIKDNFWNENTELVILDQLWQGVILAVYFFVDEIPHPTKWKEIERITDMTWEYKLSNWYFNEYLHLLLLYDIQF